MKPILKSLVLIFALLALLGAASSAPSGYSLSWWTTASGGTSSGGNYILDGAAGQADAGTLSGGSYRLDGGFVVGTNIHINLPLVRR